MQIPHCCAEYGIKMLAICYLQLLLINDIYKHSPCHLSTISPLHRPPLVCEMMRCVRLYENGIPSLCHPITNPIPMPVGLILFGFWRKTLKKSCRKWTIRFSQKQTHQCFWTKNICIQFYVLRGSAWVSACICATRDVS